MNTREKIIDTTRRMLQERAYHGFSFQDIADEIGIKKASLYHHFRSKDAAAIAVLDDTRQRMEAHLTQASAAPADEQLDRYLTAFRSMQGAGARMCPGGSLAGSMGAVSPAVQLAAGEFARFHVEWLTQILTQGRDAGLFALDDPPEQEAQYLMAVLQGALVTARLTGQKKLYDNAVKRIKRDLYRVKAHR